MATDGQVDIEINISNLERLEAAATRYETAAERYERWSRRMLWVDAAIVAALLGSILLSVGRWVGWWS